MKYSYRENGKVMTKETYLGKEIPKNIEVLLGKEMGLSDEYFRLNIGCSSQIFNEFIKL